MEVAAVAVQQSMTQSAVGLSMIKNKAQADQAIVNMIAQSVPPSSTRGVNLDISV